jgi:ABC-2 type transport system ATP-binding protein
LRNGTIDATEIWKRFRADRRGAKIQDEVARVVARLRKRSTGGWRWALRGIDFQAEPGESIGLVGANGSGKTTLLKILTRVMYPTAGRVAVEGRVGALIALSAGMHPNLTGRENIVLTGSVMGLTRKQINQRFDEIVAFAELEEAIDRQAKYYSQGMLARLGFGVAAFLEPDVLLVDEVLAVGDARFQQRCLDRMRYILQKGTTLVLVSHDLATVEATCARGIWLHNGQLMSDGPVRDVLSEYKQSFEGGNGAGSSIAGRISLADIHLSTPNGGMVKTEEPLDIDLTFTSDRSFVTWIYLGITEGTASPIFVVNPGREVHVREGENRVRCRVPRLPVPRGRYSLWVGAWEGWTNGEELLAWQAVSNFDVWGPQLDAAPRAVVRLAPFHVETNWAID